jgi:A/G-specific adenine glycosylase
MLQQTRVAQGTPYFFSLQLLSHCFDLAEASEEQVLKLWQGLDIILEHEICIKQPIYCF